MNYTLVAEGTSDRVLIPLLTWSLQRFSVSEISAQWADFSRIPRAQGLAQKLAWAVDLYPCDLLFVHRDSDAELPVMRRTEIEAAVAGLGIRHVPVVPVRMTEAWLLIDEAAIRRAAGNPNGREDLHIPRARDLEAIPDPKQVLHEALSIASSLNSRRRARFRADEKVHAIPNFIEDYSQLDALPAFQQLQADIRQAVVA